MSLTDVVGRMASTSLQVTRALFDPGYDANGRPAVATTSALYILALYYPATAEELLRLSEGERTDARMVFWTSSQLYLRDVIRADNVDWQVEAVEYSAITTAYKALGRKVVP